MNDKIIKRIFIFLFCVWCVVWAKGLCKDIKNNYRETVDLIGKSQEEKWEYVFGLELYEYLSEAKKIIPKYETIRFESDNIDEYKMFRALYFLYPTKLSENESYILVYQNHFEKNKNQKIVFAKDKYTYIIKNQ